MPNVVVVNVNSGFVYQARARIPNAEGQLASPLTLGEITGLKLRLCATPGGAAIDAAVDDLPAVENAEEPGLFEVAVSQDTQQDWLLPLGRGKKFYGVWSKDGVADFLVDTFVTATTTDV